MSAPAAPSSAPTTKTTASDSTSAAQQEPSKPTVALEEDDEFEDFPVEGVLARYVNFLLTRHCRWRTRLMPLGCCGLLEASRSTYL